MPENWETYKLADIVQYINGGAWPVSSYSDFGIPVVRVSDIKNGVIDLSACKFLDAKFKEKYSKHFLKQNDVIICTVGSHPDQQSSVVGRAGVVSKNEEGAYLNQNAVILRSSNSRILDQKWLIFFAKSKILKNHIESEARGSANQVRIAITNLLNLNFSLPPLQEQKSIASILSALDDKIELNLQMNKTLEEMAMTLYKHWFVDFGPFQDGEFVDSELGEIPKGWEVIKFGELISNKRKNVPASKIKEDDKYIGLEHIKKASLSLFSHGFGIKVSSNKTAFSKGDILFGKLRPYFKKIAIAPFDGICSTDILVIEPKKSYDYGLVLFTLFNDRFIGYTTTVSGGTRMPRVNWNNIENYKVNVPKSPELIQKFDIIVRNHISQILYNVSENQTLIQLRDTLLPKLISGEVRVKDAEKTLSEVL